MLSFYLAFLYIDTEYYDKNRILCMSKYLFEVQAKNRLAQKGVLKRFSINCYGHQKTLKEIFSDKNEKYKKIKKNSKDYEKYFLRYNGRNNKINETKKIFNKKFKTKKNKKGLFNKTRKYN